MSSTFKLERLNDYCWTISRDNYHYPVKLYGNQKIIDELDAKVLEQIVNVAQLPGLVGDAMTMPDAHWGYGFPIGGVAAFDANKGGIISAGGVGFDISCGIRCLRSNLFIDDIIPHAQEIADLLFTHIPSGVGRGGSIHLTPQKLDEVLIGGAKWAVNQGYGNKDDLAFIEEHGQMTGAIPVYVSELAKERQRGEMGSLGSGNHYCEIQIVDEIFDEKAADTLAIQPGQVIISVHCGSRGLGHQIGSDYLVLLAKAGKKYGIQLPERELACAPINSEEGQQYIGAMNAGINCALANRQILTHLVRQVFSQVLPKTVLTTLYDVSHNTCKRETHIVNGKPRELYIHRKGATRAFAPDHPSLPKEYKKIGQPVVIGGSMGTASYLLAGNSTEQNHALASASHGAGRVLSRRQALKNWQGRELVKSLSTRGILIMSASMRGIAEEAPGAYKDVDIVAEVTEKAGLARRAARLLPKICVKG